MSGPTVTEHMSGLVLTKDQIEPAIIGLSNAGCDVSRELSHKIAQAVVVHFNQRLPYPPAWAFWMLDDNTFVYEDGRITDHEFFDPNPGLFAYEISGNIRLTIRKLSSGKYTMNVVRLQPQPDIEAQLAAAQGLERQLVGLSVAYPLAVFEGMTTFNLAPATLELARRGFALEGMKSERLSAANFDEALSADRDGRALIRLAHAHYPQVTVSLALLGCQTVTVTPAKEWIIHFTRSGASFTLPVSVTDGVLDKPSVTFIVSWSAETLTSDRNEADLRAVTRLLTTL